MIFKSLNICCFKLLKKIRSNFVYIPDIRVTQWTGEANKNGVTSGYISIRDPATEKWVPKKGETTFFPKDWSKRKTAEEIQSAFANAKPGTAADQWQGNSSSGLKIEGYYNKMVRFLQHGQFMKE